MTKWFGLVLLVTLQFGLAVCLNAQTNDDEVISLNRSEQLLGGQATSRSTRFRVFDPADDGESHPVGSIGAETVEQRIPAASVLLIAGFETLAHRQ